MSCVEVGWRVVGGAGRGVVARDRSKRRCLLCSYRTKPRSRYVREWPSVADPRRLSSDARAAEEAAASRGDEMGK